MPLRRPPGHFAVLESSPHGTWRSLVAHLTGGQGVAGSNPVVPTENVHVRAGIGSVSKARRGSDVPVDVATRPVHHWKAFARRSAAARCCVTPTWSRCPPWSRTRSARVTPAAPSWEYLTRSTPTPPNGAGCVARSLAGQRRERSSRTGVGRCAVRGTPRFRWRTPRRDRARRGQLRAAQRLVLPCVL